MPMRDHFQPGLRGRRWEELLATWPAMVVQRLMPHLPPGYVAGPRVRLGRLLEVDIGTKDRDVPEPESWLGQDSDQGGGLATAVYAPPAPTLAVEADLGDFDAFEVLVHDTTNDWEDGRLVAAIELVSPRNKDRPEARQDFAAKCGGLLRAGVCVTLVDLVTRPAFNLAAQLFADLGRPGTAYGAEPPPTYAVTLRPLPSRRPVGLQVWAHTLAVGETLPTPPTWLDRQALPLPLEDSYEEACRTLKIDG